jgi:hypothetical protein
MAAVIRFAKKHPRQVIGWAVFIPVTAVFFVTALVKGQANHEQVSRFCSGDNCTCTEWGRPQVKDYQVENNIWNKGKITDYSQCVFIDPAGSGVDVGWAWSWPGMRFNVVAYPNVIFGKNPWLPQSTTADIPDALGELGCLEARFDAFSDGLGKGNLTFDLWITDQQASGVTDIYAEIMIWLTKESFSPPGLRSETLALEGRSMGFWKRTGFQVSEEYEWTFLAFVYEEPVTTGPVPLSAFLDYLVANGHLSPEHTLAAIQFGNEVVSGYGQTRLEGYEIVPCSP